MCTVSVCMAVLEQNTVIREQYLFRELSDEHSKNSYVSCIKLPKAMGAFLKSCDKIVAII